VANRKFAAALLRASNYPSGLSTFYFTSFGLPSWIVPGMNVAVFDKSLGGFVGGTTTIATISTDRTMMTTTAECRFDWRQSGTKWSENRFGDLECDRTTP
jgi:hypothetical protein